MPDKNAATMSVSLPKDLKEQVKKLVKKEYFGTPSDYIRSLIREDIKRQEQELLETRLMEGLASPNIPMTSKEWRKLRGAVSERLRNNH